MLIATSIGTKCLNESLARCENVKSVGVGKYVQPSAHYELACYYTDEKDYTLAKAQLTMAQNYKEFELDNRILVQIRSLNRKIKFLTEEKSSANDKSVANKEEELQKQKNFFISWTDVTLCNF